MKVIYETPLRHMTAIDFIAAVSLEFLNFSVVPGTVVHSIGQTSTRVSAFSRPKVDYRRHTSFCQRRGPHQVKTGSRNTTISQRPQRDIVATEGQIARWVVA